MWRPLSGFGSLCVFVYKLVLLQSEDQGFNQQSEDILQSGDILESGNLGWSSLFQRTVLKFKTSRDRLE